MDSKIKSKSDNPSIGIILCKNRDKVIAEYALRNMSKPIGVSEYKLSRVIPEKLRKALPSTEDIEAELKEQRKAIPFTKKSNKVLDNYHRDTK